MKEQKPIQAIIKKNKKNVCKGYKDVLWKQRVENLRPYQQLDLTCNAMGDDCNL